MRFHWREQHIWVASTNRGGRRKQPAGRGHPWLRRTQWAVYLQGINPQDIINNVQTPDAESLKATEQAACVIWDSTATVARISRLSCTSNRSGPYGAGLATASAAASLYGRQKHRETYAPVAADPDVFIRTQAPHELASLRYRFSQRQRAAWNSLWRLG
ncbi:hypothetical protein PENARI_c019G09597 [Penicillium arizonense]|uniref:Uncharacterized protein n=1 Tax=Penicillium arizonense TaxID=1835702 RepID=A0A1F5LA74_PENAI|nr:hypothetical protein PENARI_c019G09597 [Penicillium arizonense]OGE49956.1 hypothetical protein PENARI_c019G09597 [Penicillium arizonense]